MHRWVKSRVSVPVLAVVVLILGLGLFGVEKFKVQVPHRAYVLQVEAAETMAQSFAVIRTLRESLGIPIDPVLDPNGIGIIGGEFTELTTSLGNLDAKRTSTNPDFAALLVRYFTELGLSKGDLVAIGASGSFPALIVATLAACKVLELEPMLIYSVGASMYGANLPEMTFIEMLKELQKTGVLPYELLAVSLGGDGDRAEGLFFTGSKETILKLAEGANCPVIYADTLEESIRIRLQMYAAEAGEREIKCFVNIGGASANYGNTGASLKFPNGLVTAPPSESSTSPERGLIFEYALRGLPVIHLLNIQDLALKNGLPVDPMPLPRPGQSKVYYEVKYHRLITFLVILSVSGLLYRGVRRSKGVSLQ